MDELSAYLDEKGYSVKPYHAGLHEMERKQNQELFIRDQVQIIVATVAFGMGINKSNIRFVIHFDLPKNIESYYQEIGRAGRDGVRSHCLLLFGYGDIRKIRFFIDQKEGHEQRLAQQHLNTLIGFAETEFVPAGYHCLSISARNMGKTTADCATIAPGMKKDLIDLTIPRPEVYVLYPQDPPDFRGRAYNRYPAAVPVRKRY